jgi:hypothetical protein
LCSAAPLDSPVSDGSGGAMVDPLIEGKSLADIVGSYQVGSPLGLCSSCHFKDTTTATFYKPSVTPGVAQTIPPEWEIAFTIDYTGGNGGLFNYFESSGSYSWAEPGGWVAQFTEATNKPASLKQAFQKWIDDGAQ